MLVDNLQLYVELSLRFCSFWVLQHILFDGMFVSCKSRKQGIFSLSAERNATLGGVWEKCNISDRKVVNGLPEHGLNHISKHTTQVLIKSWNFKQKKTDIPFYILNVMPSNKKRHCILNAESSRSKELVCQWNYERKS